MKVSIALCTYNGEEFLAEQLQSIFAQCHAVDEIIICDDGSNDSTLEIVAQFADKWPGIIKIFKNDTNLRVVKNFEKAVTKCTGDVIFFCDQDDVWKTSKVQTVVSFFEQNSQYLGVFSDAELIDDSSSPLNLTMWEVLIFKEFATPKMDILKYIVLHGNVVTGACLAIKKEALPLILPFEDIKLMLHDELTAIKLGKLNCITLINETLIQYRVHKGQQTNVLTKVERLHENEVKKTVIKGDASAYPIEYYRYWKKRGYVLEEIMMDGFTFPQPLLDAINAERKKGLLAFLSTYRFITKKRNLFRLWLNNEENIKFYDCLFS